MIRLAISPCPNDTFIFEPIVHQRIDLEGLSFDVRLEDVETLNGLALQGEADMIKVSFHAYLSLSEKYELLNSGCALGSGVGPLLISKNSYAISDLQDLAIAIPGEHTTAHLLLTIAVPKVREKKIFVFHEIEDAILSGKVDAGVIIHESRFTYEKKGLRKILDLGEYWENLTHSPIPLGGIIAGKDLGAEVISKLNRIMRRSVEYAAAHPKEVMPYVRCHAQEMDEEVMQKHIALYVNRYTVDLGDDGRKAVETLSEIFHRKR
jgi:1,4-dihydroxy-6-naphthoate synthase